MPDQTSPLAQDTLKKIMGDLGFPPTTYGRHMGPQELKLRSFFMARILDPHEKMVSYGVTWGPAAHLMSHEERAKSILEVEAQLSAYKALPLEEKMRIDILRAYEAMHKAMDLCKVDVRTMFDPEDPEVLRKKLMKIFGLLEMPALHLGNYVSNAERESIRKRRDEEG